MCQALRGTPSLGRAGSLSVNTEEEKKQDLQHAFTCRFKGKCKDEAEIKFLCKRRRLTLSMMSDVLRAMC